MVLPCRKEQSDRDHPCLLGYLGHMRHVVRKPVLPYVNNRGAEQPAYPRSLISTFIVRFLDSIIPLLAISEISRLELASEAEQACLRLTW